MYGVVRHTLPMMAFKACRSSELLMAVQFVHPCGVPGALPVLVLRSSRQSFDEEGERISTVYNAA